jgi:hypothetical protein
MWLIQIDVQAAATFSEVLREDVENTRLVIMDLVGKVLLPFFSSVIFDEVTIAFSSPPLIALSRCSIHIQASGANDEWNLQDLADMELLIEEQLSLPLTELFGMVEVDQLMIRPGLQSALVA